MPLPTTLPITSPTSESSEKQGTKDYHPAWVLHFFGAATPKNAMGLLQSLKKDYAAFISEQNRTTIACDILNTHEEIAVYRSVGLTVSAPFDQYSLPEGSSGLATAKGVVAQLKERLLKANAPLLYSCQTPEGGRVAVYGYDAASDRFLVETQPNELKHYSPAALAKLINHHDLNGLLELKDSGHGVRAINYRPIESFRLQEETRNYSEQVHFDFSPTYKDDPILRMRMGWVRQ